MLLQASGTYAEILGVKSIARNLVLPGHQRMQAMQVQTHSLRINTAQIQDEDSSEVDAANVESTLE